jgi:hypothetical protein
MNTKKGTDDIESILGPDEKVLFSAEEKISHPDINVDSLAVTNERIILRQPHEAGAKPDFTGIKYSEIEGVELARGRRKFTIKVNFKDGRDPLELGFPLTPVAEQAHGIIGANLDLLRKPDAENVEGAAKEEAVSEPEGTERDADEAPAPAKNAPSEEGAEEVTEEEKSAPAAGEKPKRRATRKRPASANKAKSSEEEIAQDNPTPEPEEAREPEDTGPDKPSIDEEPEEDEITAREEDVQLPTASTEDGWIEIDGKRYEHDVIVHTDGTVSKRDKSLSKAKKAKYGHTPLTGKEVKLLLKESPDVIIIGTGQTGALPITPKAKTLLEAVPCKIGPTPQALEWAMENKRRAVALFHVTC